MDFFNRLLVQMCALITERILHDAELEGQVAETLEVAYATSFLIAASAKIWTPTLPLSTKLLLED